MDCEATDALPQDMREFHESLIRLYLATEEYIWGAGLDRMRFTMRRLLLSIVPENQQARTDERIQMLWELVFDLETYQRYVPWENVPARIIERIATDIPDWINEFVLEFSEVYSGIMILYEALRVPLYEPAEIGMYPDVEDVRDTALRFALLIFEVHLQAHGIRLRGEQKDPDYVILVMEDALRKDLENRTHSSLAGVKWLQGLRLAAIEIHEVQAKVDEVFEELVLV